MNYKKKATVSIGMAVYNETRWIKQALDSLLAQTFNNFELIISDNASSDGTWNILQEYAAKDTRITLYCQPENIGAIENFEFVLAQAAGEYFMWASGHDLWSGNLLEVLLKELQDNPRLVLCVPQGVLIDDNNYPITVYDEVIDTRSAQSAAGRIFVMHRQLKRGNAIYGLHRRDVLARNFPWPRVPGWDSVVLLKIVSMGDIVTIPAAQWFRRQNRPETTQQAAERRGSTLGVSKFARRFPYLTTRIILMKELLKANGSYRERVVLLTYELKRLFLDYGPRKLLLTELFSARSIPNDNS
jgi:glycosyltransferase involved in cell wall biosynthesis